MSHETASTVQNPFKETERVSGRQSLLQRRAIFTRMAVTVLEGTAFKLRGNLPMKEVECGGVRGGKMRKEVSPPPVNYF